MGKYLKVGAYLLLLFWIGGAYFYLPEMNRQLDQAAFEKLSETKFQGVFDQVKAKFSGQEATLSGVVALEEEKQLAEKTIAAEVRLPNGRGANHNPVIAVHNEIRVDVNSTNRKRPWILVSLFPGNQRIDGVLKSADQRAKLIAQMVARAPQATVNNQVIISESALSASAWNATLEQVPDFNRLLAEQKDSGPAIIAVTSGDGNWTVFPPTATDEEIAARLKESKISPTAVSHSLSALRTWRTSQDSAAKP